MSVIVVTYTYENHVGEVIVGVFSSLARVAGYMKEFNSVDITFYDEGNDSGYFSCNKHPGRGYWWHRTSVDPLGDRIDDYNTIKL